MDVLKLNLKHQWNIRHTIKRLYEQPFSKKKSTKSLIGSRVVVKDIGQSCGSYDVLDIHMDSEDHHTANSKAGWIGDNIVNGNITLRFCLVPKNLFSASKYYQYAVLSLDYGWENMIERYFDNEDDNNDNWIKLNGTRLSSSEVQNELGNGISQTGNTRLCFYVYNQNISSGATSFPNLGIHYGVLGYFGTGSKGWIYSDDEDSNNANKCWYNWYYIPKSGNEDWQFAVRNIIDVSDKANTKIYMTHVY